MSKRNSMWHMMIPDLKRKVRDVADKSALTDPDLIEELYTATVAMDDTIGICRAKTLKFAFNPVDNEDHTNIRNTVYENESNMSVGYELYATEASVAASIESKALAVRDKSIALMQLFWSQSGDTGTEPVIDVSLDKDPVNGDELPGTWLVENDRIDPILSGTKIDMSMFHSISFALKWKFSADANYRIQDTICRMLLVDTAKMFQRQGDIVLVAAYNILTHEAAKSLRKGQGANYVELLKTLADRYLSDARGYSPDGAKASTTEVRAIEHNHDRNFHADRAFRRAGGGLKDGDENIGINGNLLDGVYIKTIRYLDEV
jgi:hypothetical protein